MAKSLVVLQSIKVFGGLKMMWVIIAAVVLLVLYQMVKKTNNAENKSSNSGTLYINEDYKWKLVASFKEGEVYHITDTTKYLIGTYSKEGKVFNLDGEWIGGSSSGVIQMVKPPDVKLLGEACAGFVFVPKGADEPVGKYSGTDNIAAGAAYLVLVYEGVIPSEAHAFYYSN